MDTVLMGFTKLPDEPDELLRSQLAKQICIQFSAGAFNSDEAKIVEDILMLLAEDLAVVVRKVIAEELKDNPHLPHSVARLLAGDELEVALPLLEFSPVFSEKDLLELIASTREAARHVALAKRTQGLSAEVSRALVNTSNASVAFTLFSNPSSQLDESTLLQSFLLYKDNQSVLGKLVQHGNMSMALAERVIASASTEVQRVLAQRFGVTNSIAEQIGRRVHAEATGDLIEAGRGDTTKVYELVNHLFYNNRLNHSVILRALCHGDLAFFEAGLAKLAGIPLANAKKLLRTGSEYGFQALYRACNLPDTMLEATEILVRLAIEEEKQGSRSEIYAAHLIQRITESGYDRTVPNMNYILALLNDKSRDTTYM
jgi:uncharacterized protein (DUF2336 family)